MNGSRDVCGNVKIRGRSPTARGAHRARRAGRGKARAAKRARQTCAVIETRASPRLARDSVSLHCNIIHGHRIYIHV